MTTRRTVLVLLVLTALLCAACTPDAPPPHAPDVAAPVIPVPAVPAPSNSPPTPAAPAAAPDLLGWWDRPEALVSLGLTAAEGAALGIELHKLERSHQTAQRQLYTVQRTQAEMLREPRVPSPDIRRFNRENLQKLLASMRDDDINARLWVRERLSVDQRARVLERSPQFFDLQWFRPARVPE
jgi:hypothetical protein